MPEPTDPEPIADPAPAPVTDPAPVDPEPPASEPTPVSDNSVLRNLRAEQDKLRRELAAYKSREEEQRKATLTEEQRRQEEVTELRREAERLRTENLQNKIAAEFRLPPSLAVRLIGSDEESMRADAAELAKLLPKPTPSRPTEPVRDNKEQRIFTRAELAADPKLAASPEVRLAAREGRIR